MDLGLHFIVCEGNSPEMNRLHLLPIPIYRRSSDVLACTKRLILGGFNYLNSIITAEVLHSAGLQPDLFRCFNLVLLELLCVACTYSGAWSLWHPSCSNRLLQQQASAGRRYLANSTMPVYCGAAETEVNKLLTWPISKHLGFLSLSPRRIRVPSYFIKWELNIYSPDIRMLLKLLCVFC